MEPLHLHNDASEIVSEPILVAVSYVSLLQCFFCQPNWLVTVYQCGYHDMSTYILPELMTLGNATEMYWLTAKHLDATMPADQAHVTD